MSLKKQNNLIGIGLVLLCVAIFVTPVLTEYLNGYDVFIHLMLALSAGMVFCLGLICIGIGMRRVDEESVFDPLPPCDCDAERWSGRHLANCASRRRCGE